MTNESKKDKPDDLYAMTRIKRIFEQISPEDQAAVAAWVARKWLPAEK